jgi:hypothetical protein
MSDEPENLMLVCLRRPDAKMDGLREDIFDLKHRVTAVEIAVAGLAASQLSHYASLPARLDRVEQRLGRVERRLDIVAA